MKTNLIVLHSKALNSKFVVHTSLKYNKTDYQHEWTLTRLNSNLDWRIYARIVAKSLTQTIKLNKTYKSPGIFNIAFKTTGSKLISNKSEIMVNSGKFKRIENVDLSSGFISANSIGIYANQLKLLCMIKCGKFNECLMVLYKTVSNECSLFNKICSSDDLVQNSTNSSIYFKIF